MIRGMAHFPQPQRNVRAPRVRVPEAEPVVFMAENSRIPALLQNLSTTGGSARLSRQFSPGALAELQMHTPSGPIHALVEILDTATAPGAGQPFRFVALGDEDQERLWKAVAKLQRRGYSESAFGARF